MAVDIVSPEKQPIGEAEPDRCHAELNRLFYLYRLANLNARYYGRRAAWFEGCLRYSLVLVAAISALALALVLGVDPKEQWARNTAALGSGLATVLMSVIPALGWSGRATELRNLHFGYSQLFTQVESVITEIRRSDHLTDEQVGMSRMVHDFYLRLHALDELNSKQKIINQEAANVREAFPENYIWDRF